MVYEKLIEKLKAKGWSNKDIVSTIRILNDSSESKNHSAIALDAAVYWIALILMIMGSIVLSIIMIPSFIALSSFALYFIIIVISYAFGTMFSILINEIEAIQGRKIVAQVFIPALALINMYYITRVTNIFTIAMNIKNNHNPFLMSAIYAFFFIAPYFINEFIKKIRVIKIE
jgi:hypothetical protein